MQNDRTRADASATPRRVLVGEAAELLGISEGAVRMRVERGTLDSTREGGRLYVLLHGAPTGAQTRPHDLTNELIATLREQLEAELRFVRGGTDGSRLSERGLPTRTSSPAAMTFTRATNGPAWPTWSGRRDDRPPSTGLGGRDHERRKTS